MVAWEVQGQNLVLVPLPPQLCMCHLGRFLSTSLSFSFSRTMDPIIGTLQFNKTCGSMVCKSSLSFKYIVTNVREFSLLKVTQLIKKKCDARA